MTIVSKFGGTSVADAKQLHKVKKIVYTNPDRQDIVFSAPGKTQGREYKATDILFNLYRNGENIQDNRFKFINQPTHILWDELFDIYMGIAKGIGQEDTAIKVLDELKKILNKKHTLDEVVSRGEYMSAKIASGFLRAEFVDAIDFFKNGKIDKNYLLGNGLKIFPGFYQLLNGEISLLHRGGSDYTGAMIAAEVDASLYEVWSDTDGIKVANPNYFDFIIPSISQIGFVESRELAYMGTAILDAESVRPVKEKNIPVLVKNTNNPSHKGTLITTKPVYDNLVRGIASRNGFSKIDFRQYGLNSTVGYSASILNILKEENISYEHMPSGIDSMSLVFEEKYLQKGNIHLIQRLKNEIGMESINYSNKVSLVAVVGEGVSNNVEVLSGISYALKNTGIEKINMLSMGGPGSAIIFGVDSNQEKNVVKSLYNQFFR